MKNLKKLRIITIMQRPNFIEDIIWYYHRYIENKVQCGLCTIEEGAFNRKQEFERNTIKCFAVALKQTLKSLNK